MDLPESVLLQELVPLMEHRYSRLTVFLCDNRYAYMLHKHVAKLNFDGSNLARLVMFSSVVDLSLEVRTHMNLFSMVSVRNLKLSGTRDHRRLTSPFVSKYSIEAVTGILLPSEIVSITLNGILGVVGEVLSSLRKLEVIKADMLHGHGDMLPPSITHVDVPYLMITSMRNPKTVRHLNVSSVLDTYQYTSLEYISTKFTFELNSLPSKLTTLGCVLKISHQTLFPIGLTVLHVDKMRIPFIDLPRTLTLLCINKENDLEPIGFPPSLTKLALYADLDFKIPSSIVSLRIMDLLDGNCLPPNLTDLYVSDGNPFDPDITLPISLTKLDIYVESDIDLSYLVNLKEISIPAEPDNVVTLPSSVKYVGFGYGKTNLPEGLLSFDSYTRHEYPDVVFPANLRCCLMRYVDIDDSNVDNLPSGLLFLHVSSVNLTDWSKLPKGLIYACFDSKDKAAAKKQLPKLEYNFIDRDDLSWMLQPEELFKRLYL